MRLVVCGELDLAVTDRLREAIEAHAAPGTAVVVDLRGLEFMDSTGLSTLIAAHGAAGRQGWQLAIISGEGPVHRLFELTGTRDVLRFVDSAADVSR